MKKLVYAIIISSILFTVLSCQKKSTVSGQDDRISNSQTGSTVPGGSNSGKFDFDFSKMNYNMISSIVFEMMIAPENYTDKTAKIEGNFYSTVNEGKTYSSILVWDATGCCPTGLPVVPSDSAKEKFSTLQQEEKVTATGKIKYLPSEENSPELIFLAKQIE